MQDLLIKDDIINICKKAKNASLILSLSSNELRAKAIKNMADELIKVKEILLNENKKDIENAVKNNLSRPFIKRLTIYEKIFNYMLNKINYVADMQDPLGKIIENHTMPNGLIANKISVPLGVIGIIYESRPNVTTDAASVCVKSGNAVILRGGSETINSNIILAEAMRKALAKTRLPEDAVQIIKTIDHEAVDELLKQDKYIDVLIPRGGKDLIKKITEGTKIPTIKHYEGICHIYIAEDASVDMAVNIAVNSKCQSVEVCNALEKLLIDNAIADKILPVLKKTFEKNNVEIRACEKSRQIIPELKKAEEEDWITEYLAPIITIKIVDNIEEAINHINKYGSHHTDGIISKDQNLINKFINSIDSASIMINSSTRLSGGGEFGLGPAVGISTDKLHARGPVGINELTTYKWIVYGNGHIRE